MLDAQKPLERANTRTSRTLFCGIGALTVLGFVLRVAAARGDLWLDEIWSIQNLAHISSVGGIFWGISQDNNHILNSLWLWFVGPNAPAVVIRFEAIVMGTLTIPVAARLCARAGPVAAVTGAALVAAGAIFVHYGSEARGYAGLILMVFIAAEALETFLDDQRTGRSRLVFGTAVALGALFHLTMLTAAFALVVATLVRIHRRCRRWHHVFTAAVDLAIPAVLGALPALAFLVAGILNTHKLQVGVQVPFSIEQLGKGLATLYEGTLGLPYDWPLPLAVAVAVILTLVALWLVPAERRILPLTCLALLPLMAAIVKMPNVHIVRFHLIGALGLVLLASEMIERLWSSQSHAFACLIAIALAAGNALHVSELLTLGRGDSERIVVRMESLGPATYGSNMPAEVGRTLDFYDARNGARLKPVAAATWCGLPPSWFILSDDPKGEAPIRDFGPARCRAAFQLQMVVKPAPLSGLRLALYRRRSD